MQTASLYDAETSADPDWRRAVSDIVPGDSGISRPDARQWTRILGRYSTTNRLRSIAELAITALPLVMLWIAAWFAFSIGHSWASSLIAIPAAGFLLRLFVIQHDCGHGTFFAHRLVKKASAGKRDRVRSRWS